jgi:hypothetical protein
VHENGERGRKKKGKKRKGKRERRGVGCVKWEKGRRGREMIKGRRKNTKMPFALMFYFILFAFLLAKSDS